MVGKRVTEVRRPGLKAGLVGGAEPVEGVEPTGEAEPVELEAGPVNTGHHAWRILGFTQTQACTYPGSGARTGQPPPSSDLRLLLPSSEDGFRRSRRPPAATAAAASSTSPSSNRRALYRGWSGCVSGQLRPNKWDRYLGAPPLPRHTS